MNVDSWLFEQLKSVETSFPTRLYDSLGINAVTDITGESAGIAVTTRVNHWNAKQLKDLQRLSGAAGGGSGCKLSLNPTCSGVGQVEVRPLLSAE